MLEYENALWDQNVNLISGIDEVGRGTLLGDIVAAAVILPPRLVIEDINDSKKLSEKKRLELYDKIMESAIDVGIGIVSSDIIDEINIKQAARLAMRKALDQLKMSPDYLLVDAEKVESHIQQLSIINGDALSQSIAAASIIAKVTRDKLCENYDMQYPEYGIAIHKGYATRLHREKIIEFGPCPLHRKSFLGTILQPKEVLFNKVPAINKKEDNDISQSKSLLLIEDDIGESVYTDLNKKGDHLTKRLSHLPAGKEHWREYEELCINIFSFIFSPPFEKPIPQSTTIDGLDRRDVIYTIAGGNPYWDRLLDFTKSFMVVVEIKNYTEPPGQKEVESLQSYLYKKGARNLGILCSRKSPNDSAIKARVRSWREQDKLIIFLNDDDLVELIRIKCLKEDPSTLIKAQMDEFFIRLSP